MIEVIDVWRPLMTATQIREQQTELMRLRRLAKDISGS